MTRLLLLDADRADRSTTPKPRFPDAMIASLRAGGTVIFPTDTLYGLGVDPCSKTGLNRLLAAKGRDRGKPIPLLLSEGEQVERWARHVSLSGAVTGTSANRSGNPAAWGSPEEIVREFTGEVDWVLWGGKTPSGDARRE